MPAALTPPAADPRRTARGLAWVLGLVLVYVLLHAGFRLLASDTLGEDDILDTLLAQDLRLGYPSQPLQPPLYDWLLWAVQQAMGTGIAGFLLIKYAALTATAALLYLAALRALKDPLFALLSVESLALIYQIFWRFHEAFTHQVLAMVAVMATVWLALRLADGGGRRDWLALGAVTGLGLLTEPAYATFLLALLLAGLLQPALRRRLLRPALAGALLLALLIATPYLAWLAAEPQRLAGLRLDWQAADVLHGLKNALRMPFLYLSPLLLILPALFPGWLRTAWADLRRRPNADATPDYEQWLLHAGLIALGLSVLGALLFGIGRYAVHAVMPLYLATAIWLFGVARRAEAGESAVRRFTRFALLLAVVALLGRLANMYVLDPVCKKCRWGIPYAGLAAELRACGFSRGTVLGVDPELLGNLRAQLPDSHFVVRGGFTVTPAGADWTRGQLALVWSSRQSDTAVAGHLADFLPARIAIEQAGTLTIPWQHLWRPTGYRHSAWRVLLVDLDDGMPKKLACGANPGKDD